MTDNIVKNLSSATNHIGADVLLIILSLMLLAGFIVDLLLSIFLIGFGLKKRIWFVFYSLGVSLFGIALFSRNDYAVFFFTFLMGESLMCCIPLYLLPEKTLTESKKFINYIDDEIEKSGGFIDSVVPVNQSPQKTSEIDYSHVKSVIERLNGMDISPSDNREIKTLYKNLTKAESGEKNCELKEKINDGLGHLLKIMAKYGA